MKVRELVKLLLTENQDAKVVFYDNDKECTDVSSDDFDGEEVVTLE